MFKRTLKVGLIAILALTWASVLIPAQITQKAYAEDFDCNSTVPAKIEEQVEIITNQNPPKLSDFALCMQQIQSQDCSDSDIETCLANQEESINIVETAKAASSTKMSTEDSMADNFGEDIVGSLKTDMCLTETEQKTKIAVYTEEQILETPPPGSTNIKNCFRNTFCLDRGNGLECISYNNKSEHCTAASSKIDFNPTTGNATLKSDTGEIKKRVSISCEPIQVILGNDGLDILYSYIGMLYTWGASVVGIIAVLVLVISGIQISAAAGDQNALTAAKTRIFQSLMGLAILFLSAIILYTINPTFFIK